MDSGTRTAQRTKPNKRLETDAQKYARSSPRAFGRRNWHTDMKPPKPIVLLFLFALFAGCNEPPLYEKHAREFLRTQGISNDIIEKLTARQPLEPDVAEQLLRYENVGVLHLLAANPGTPQAIIDRLARHKNFEVRTGVASNPNVSLDLLLSLRTPGKYTTVNAVIARNPRLPQAIIWEMHKNGEAGYLYFGMNPNCPADLMREIGAKGDWLARGWLAQNPNLPEDVVQKLARDKREDVRMRLTFNPNLPEDVLQTLARDSSKLVRDHAERHSKHNRKNTEPSR